MAVFRECNQIQMLADSERGKFGLALRSASGHYVPLFPLAGVKGLDGGADFAVNDFHRRDGRGVWSGENGGNCPALC